MPDEMIGRLLNTINTQMQTYSCSPTIADGVLYVGSGDGTVYAFHLPSAAPTLVRHATP